jgi:hypothetical protein
LSNDAKDFAAKALTSDFNGLKPLEHKHCKFFVDVGKHKKLNDYVKCKHCNMVYYVGNSAKNKILKHLKNKHENLFKSEMEKAGLGTTSRQMTLQEVSKETLNLL